MYMSVIPTAHALPIGYIELYSIARCFYMTMKCCSIARHRRSYLRPPSAMAPGEKQNSVIIFKILPHVHHQSPNVFGVALGSLHHYLRYSC
jgi:hypothetical protein